MPQPGAVGPAVWALDGGCSAQPPGGWAGWDHDLRALHKVPAFVEAPVGLGRGLKAACDAIAVGLAEARREHGRCETFPPARGWVASTPRYRDPRERRRPGPCGRRRAARGPDGRPRRCSAPISPLPRPRIAAARAIATVARSSLAQTFPLTYSQIKQGSHEMGREALVVVGHEEPPRRILGKGRRHGRDHAPLAPRAALVESRATTS